MRNINRTQTGTGVTSLQYVDSGKTEQARLLRRNATPAEKILWNVLRGRKVAGLKFRRQQVIEGFIADFFCEEAKLVIEVDGSVHDDPEQRKIDRLREKVFLARGLRTIRLKNRMIHENIEGAKEIIVVAVKKDDKFKNKQK